MQAKDRAIKEWDWSGVDEDSQQMLLKQLLDTIQDWPPMTNEEVQEHRELSPESRSLQFSRRARLLFEFNREQQQESDPDQTGSES